LRQTRLKTNGILLMIMSERANVEDHENDGPKRRWPIATIAATTLVALASWKNNNPLVRGLTEVRPDSSWLTYAYRWPGSFFPASPFAGRLIDGSTAAAQTALAFGLNERKDGTTRTLKIAAISQAVGSITTRIAAVTGIVAPHDMHRVDTGPSAVTVALGTNFMVEHYRESTSRTQRLAWGAGIAALGLATTAGVYAVDPNMTDVLGHAAGFATGLVAGATAEMEEPE